MRLCYMAGRKLEIDFERNSERYVEHVSNDTEISRLRNSSSAICLPDDSSECHSRNVGHSKWVFDEEEKQNEWSELLVIFQPNWNSFRT